MTTKSDKLDRIAELWARGTLTQEIARRLNTTKGIVCRMAWEARRSGDPRFPVRPRIGRFNNVRKPQPPREPVTLMNLPVDGCKWPVKSTGERGEIHWFCNQVRAPGSPYCKTHQDLGDARVRAAVVSSWMVKP